jgi:hypothetical protein
MLRFRSIGVTIMTTVDNQKKSQTSGKDEDPKEKGFFNRPRAGGKTIWDWMQLLIIPFILVTVGYFFSNQQAQTSLLVSQQQHDADQRQALDQQRAILLQTYIDNIQDLLLNHNLLDSNSTTGVAILARARTLASLQGLDPERKGVLMKFIYEAHLIGHMVASGNPNPIIIILNGADLTRADLSRAELSYADLSFANLSSAFLSRADLSGADLSRATLGDALYLTQQQLDDVYSCEGATLPPGLTCHHNL